MRRALLCLCFVASCATAKQKEEKKEEKAAVEKTAKAEKRLTCPNSTAVPFEGGEACVAKPLAALIKCLDVGFGDKTVRRASDPFLSHRGVRVGSTEVTTANAQADFVAAYIGHTQPDIDACAIIRSCAQSEGVTPVCP
jgi:hypothetical protein